MMAGYSHADVQAWLDKLERAEPHHARGTWIAFYDRLHDTLLRARKIRRYCAAPAAIVAAMTVILLHGNVWDLDDVRNLFLVEFLALGIVAFALTRLCPVLADESRVQTILRYYGAQDVPAEHEAMQ